MDLYLSADIRKTEVVKCREFYLLWVYWADPLGLLQDVKTYQMMYLVVLNVSFIGESPYVAELWMAHSLPPLMERNFILV